MRSQRSFVPKARRLDSIHGFGIDQVAAAAEQPTEANPQWPVLRMENLDTDLPLPPEAVRVTRESLETAAANSWLPFTGDVALREAIADFTAQRTGQRYDPEREIVITVGGMEGLLNVLLATVSDGDEIVVTDPTYAGIVNRIHVAGGTPMLVPFRVVDGEWRLDRDALSAAAGAPATTGMLLMSPSMPSGGTFDEEDWRLVCDLCREHDLFLIYDAAMERLLFDRRPLVHPLRFEGMAERTVVVGSLSKEHRMIGWRVGWVAGPAETVADVGWMHVYNTTTPVGIARAAATAVLRGDQAHVGECVAELERRRDTLLRLEGWPLVRPGGGWSLLVDVAALGFEPEEASRLLLQESSIAATGMRGWGGDVAARHVRFVFSAEPVERLETIPERLAGGSLARAL